MSLEQLIENLNYDFQKIAMLKSTPNSGGQRRTLKREVIETYVRGLVKIALADQKQIICLDQPFTFDLEDGTHIEMDIPVFVKGEERPILFIEAKDYIDYDMYKRFALDCLFFKKEYEKTKFSHRTGICLDMQQATAAEKKAAVSKKLGLSEGIFHSILPSIRSSKKDLYVLSYKDDELAFYSKCAIDFIRQHLRMALMEK